MMYTFVALCLTLYTTSTLGSVVDTAEQNGCSKLVTLINDAGLKQALDSADGVTLFAPSDAAVDAIPAEVVTQLTNNKTLLQEVLKYHVVSGIKPSNDIKNDELLPTLSGNSMLRTNIYKNGQVVTAEGSTVSKADLNASNGVVHVIDKVIYPIPDMTTPIFLIFDKDLNNLGYLAYQGKLIEQLSAQSFTVFAPINTAIDKIPGQDFEDLLMNITALDGFIDSHVVQGTVYSSGLSDGMTVTSLQGMKLNIKVTSAGVTVNDVKVNKADISTTNGVIHVIDDILVTPKFPPHDDVTDTVMYTVVALCFTLYTTSTVGSVVDTAKQNGCSKLATLITDAGLKQALDSANSVTLFAPSDAAVDAIPAEVVKQLTNNKTLLQEVLKYHVVSGIKASSDIKNDELLPTLFGKSMLRTNIYKNGQVVTAEGSTVSKADLKASNGLVHVIDKVIYPIPAVATPIFLTFDKNLNNMGYLVFRGELIEKLSAQSFTVFAPLNTAIEKIPGQDYNDLLMNKTALDGFVNTHVIQGTVYSSALSEGMPVTVTTLQGFKLIIKVTSGGVTVNGANVTKADISTTNGVIHVIDDILVTPKFPPHDVPFIG